MLRPAMPSRSAVLSQQRHAVQRAAVPRCGRAYGRHSRCAPFSSRSTENPRAPDHVPALLHHRLLPVRATPEAGGAPPAAAAAPVAEAAAQPAEVSSQGSMASACSAPPQDALYMQLIRPHPLLVQVSPPATFEKTVQQLREERIAPLRQALNDSIARHTQATGVREALEAEVRETGRAREGKPYSGNSSRT